MPEFTTLKLCTAALGLAWTATAVHAEVAPNSLTEAEQRSGWKLLFDGKTADQWRNYRKDELSKGWTIEDGTISRTAGGAGGAQS